MIQPRGPLPEIYGALLGAIGAIAVWHQLPEGDPLRSTLRIAPWIAAGLFVLSRWVERSGGRRLARPRSLVEIGLLATWVAVVVSRPLWFAADRRIDGALAASFALLVLSHSARLLVAARPLLSRSRTHAVFFLLPALLYLALLPWQSESRRPDGDEPYYLLIAHSLAYDLDLDLADEYADGSALEIVGRRLEPQPGDPVGQNGEQYSRHNLPLPLLLVPAYRLFGVAGALGTMALVAAALAWSFLGVGRRYLPEHPGALLLAYGTLAAAAPLSIYSYQVWVEVPAALLLLLGLVGVRRLERSDAAPLPAVVGLLAPLLLLPLVKARFLPLSISLLALALLRAQTRRRLVPIAVALLVVVAGLLGVNAVLFGNPLKYHDAVPLLESLTEPSSYVRGLFGLFFDAAFGLFWTAPIWFLLLPGVVLLARDHKRVATDLAILATPYLLLVAPRLEWYGGWGPPFRYALVLLPLLALALVPIFEDRRRRGLGTVIVALAGVSIATTLIAVAEPGSTYSFADGRSLLTDALTRHTGLDVARMLPSYVRPRAASWLWPVLGALATVAWLTARSAGALPARVSSRGLRGGALALIAIALSAQLAGRVPTQTLEFEDPYFDRSGGDLYPDRWRPARAAFRGGWLVGKGDTLAARPIAGGRELALDVEVRTQQRRAGPTELAVYQGDRELCREPIPGTADWATIVCPAAEWEASGDPIVFRIEQPPGNKRRRPRVILDRARLTWSR